MDWTCGLFSPFELGLLQWRYFPVTTIVIDQRPAFPCATRRDNFRDEKGIRASFKSLQDAAIQPCQSADDQWRAGYQSFELEAGKSILDRRRSPGKKIGEMRLLGGKYCQTEGPRSGNESMRTRGALK